MPSDTPSMPSTPPMPGYSATGLPDPSLPRARPGVATPHDPPVRAERAHRPTWLNISLNIKVIIGSTTMAVAALAALQDGDVVPLDRRSGDRVDILANGYLIGHGEIVLIDEATGAYGVQVTQLADQDSSLA